MTIEHQRYIADMLRHSAYKSQENYVLNQIFWTLKARGIELKLITQQTVFRDDATNHVAYMDGYFPAINVMIEVDEGHHKYQKDQDQKRESDIEKVLGAIRLDTKPTVIRIDATKDIDAQVETCLDTITRLYNEAGKPKWEDISNKDVVLKTHKIVYSDNMMFYPKSELILALGLRTSSGKEFSKKGTQVIPFVELYNSKKVWFPCISDNKASGWLNDYDAVNNIFTTQQIGNFKHKDKWLEAEESFKAGTYPDRYIIFKVKDQFNHIGYKYYGKFKCIACDGIKQKETWKRISVEDIFCIDAFLNDVVDEYHLTDKNEACVFVLNACDEYKKSQEL